MKNIIYTCLFLSQTIGTPLFAQQPVKDSNLTLRDAIRIAEDNYLSIIAKASMVKAAAAGLILRQQELIPRLEVNLQATSATLNNIYGLMYPQDIVLPISGPVKTEESNTPVWGSAGGILLSWQPFTFGERNAEIRLGRAELKESDSDFKNEIFNHDLELINGWLNYLAARAVVETQKVNINRTLTLYRSVKSLTRSGLKPGVDSVIVKGEISEANIALNKAMGHEAAYKISLAGLMGVTDTSFVIVSQNISDEMPGSPLIGDSINNNPLLKLYQSRVIAEREKLSLIAHQYAPKLNFFASSFARGSGAEINGGNDYSLNGLRFSKYNYALGAMLSFPILQIFQNQTEKHIQQYRLSAITSLMDEQKLKLKQAIVTGEVYVQTATTNYAESKLQLTAAREAFREMETRYSTGLTNLPELFQIQYELAKAEEANAIALIAIWKSYLYYTQATGNINFFLNQVK
jgi:outer membrane protein TolC